MDSRPSKNIKKSTKMENNINNFIKILCDNECKKYFESSKTHAYEKVKKALPSPLFSDKVFETKLQIKTARIASPIIDQINAIDKNRFWILYYRLSEELIGIKCNQSNLSENDKMNCREYILDRAMVRIRDFDADYESLPFQETRANIVQIGEHYRDMKEIKLEIVPKQLKYSRSVVENYTKKILRQYTQKSTDSKSIRAIIENALLSIEAHNIKTYQKEGESGYLEKELHRHFNQDKNEIDLLLEPVLIELLHQEKFFNFIYNHFIHSRFIDFIRTIKDPSTLSTDDPMEPIDETRLLEEILEDYLDLIPPETQLILRLKIGEKLNNRDFIKLIYRFDCQEIDLLEHFENDEILEIKFYARNDIAISLKTNKKISKVREKIKAHSYIDREENTKREILIKLIFSEAMSAKEIGVILGYSDKQIYKRIEQVKKKILNKQKRLEPCKAV